MSCRSMRASSSTKLPTLPRALQSLRAGNFDMIIVPVPDSKDQLKHEGFIWNEGAVRQSRGG
jgi:hypothetical protein